VTGYWVVSDGCAIEGERWSSSLRAAARRVERLTAAPGRG
jgi:transketolase N-terminal domain/subunit